METAKAGASSALKLEVGKSYRTKSGEKVNIKGVDLDSDGSNSWLGKGWFYDDKGRIKDLSLDHPDTIIAPWEAEPAARGAGAVSISIVGGGGNGSGAGGRGESTVDLTKAKKGDKVKFRCGGEAVIADCDCSDDFREILFDGCADTLIYDKMNRAYWCTGHCPLDIIAIEPAPEPEFDWSTVKPGMGFISLGGLSKHPENAVWYVGPCLGTAGEITDGVIVCDVGNCHHDGLFSTNHGYLTRAPKYDVKVGA